MWLHAGLIHLASNMWGLVQAGFMAEKVHGWHVVLFLYVASGLMGNVVSAVFVPANVTVGASGAVFSLFGALWGGARAPLPPHTLCQLVALQARRSARTRTYPGTGA